MLALISHPACIDHEMGLKHPESPARLRVINQALNATPFSVPVLQLSAPEATHAQLCRAHASHYVDELFAIAPKQGYQPLDPDTMMNPATLKAALYAAGAVVLAVDTVLTDQARVAFCAVRPPGHHAEVAKAMGFCFFNNVAVGVMHALEHYGLERVAIIDFDVHHGNGTQAIFQSDARVLYCSSFEHPFYPGYVPENDNAHLLPVPLPAGTTGSQFRERVASAWFAKLRAFKPQLIFFSAGFDAHQDDPLADLTLSEADYVWLTTEIAAIARACCDGKMISVLEGGYDVDVLAQCVPAHVQAMVREV